MTTTKARATYGTEISVELVGKQTQPPEVPGEKPWEHFAWNITLTREGQSITFPYRMGVGHQETKCGKPKPHDIGRYQAPMPCQHVRCHNAGYVPTKPTLYDILTSLKADDPHGATFGEWCGDYGMDTDSRKAMDLYLACQESADRSRRFFGADWALIVEDEEYA